ncbi:MAG TPA: dUTP diphosphatase [Clostridia bacterium]|nr:dUTP diphosphatase [Clostridia bacterium]
MGRRFAVVTAYEHRDINLPRRKTRWSAGYDLESAINTRVGPGETVLVPTGLKAYMEQDEVLQVYIRSSLSIKSGLRLANGTGIIDADYVDNPENEGHIQLAIWNSSQQEVTIKKGQAVAQGIFLKYLVTNDDEAGGWRTGGFGSTDHE